MAYNPEIHHRRSIRLKNYDYAQAGAYFVTICTHNRECLFGEISNNQIQPNEYGRIVYECWKDLPNHYGHIILDVFSLMPNHVHGIIIITENNNVGAGLKPARTKPAGSEPARTDTEKLHGLPEIIRAFKTFSSRRINHIRRTSGIPVWHRNYYEHIIRNEEDLDNIREYIFHNPAAWNKDEENPDAVRAGLKPARTKPARTKPARTKYGRINPPPVR